MTNPNNHLPQDELNYPDRTKSFIRRQLIRLDTVINQRRSTDYEVSRQIYEEGLAMRDNAQAELANLNTELDENQATYSQAVVEKRQLTKVAASPYFASIDYLYPDEDEPERWHIGLKGLQDLDTFEQYVIDWRSPLASVYYEYETGPAPFESPRGTVNGSVEARRQIVIRNGELQRVLDTSQEIHDEILQEVLSRSATPRMRNIVATLQREQNQLVRVPARTNLVIQGAAGSGKTSIALHRAAFLLYSNPDIRAANILLITPNEQLEAYVSDVLPDLNEEPTTSLTWLQLAQDELGAIEGRFHRIRPGMPSAERQARAGSWSFLEKVERFCSEYARAIFVPRDIQTPSTRIKAETIAQLYEENYRHYPPLRRGHQLVDNIGNLMARGGRSKERAFRKEREQILREVQSMYQVRRLSDLYLAWIRWAREEDPDDPMATGQAWLTERLEAESKERRSRESKARAVLETSGEELVHIDPAQDDEAAAAVLVPERWDEADIAVLLLLALYFFGPSDIETHAVSHIIVDEMQDVYPLIHSWLARRFRCPATVLGDVNQALTYPLPEQFLDGLESIYEQNGPVQRAELLESYRSTFEITRFSSELLGLDSVIPFQRHGSPVEQRLFDSQDELVKALSWQLLADKAREYGMGAIIVADEETAAALKEELHLLPVRRLRPAGGQIYTADLGFDPGEQDGPLWQILPLADCKGLEFDRVLVAGLSSGAVTARALRRSGQQEADHYTDWDDERLDEAAGSTTHRRKLQLYVAATRALHSLSFYDIAD